MQFQSIGTIHSPFTIASGTPIQSARAQDVEGWIDLDPRWIDGLKDLDGFERIWLVYWFDRATSAELHTVPYLDTVPRGIFATRSPARPNPIGLSNVRLLGIEGATLRIAGLDILDGTPLLDIKPYVPKFDNHPADRIGWLANVIDRPKVADARFERK